jgi:acetyl-CoA acetyltransferase
VSTLEQIAIVGAAESDHGAAPHLSPLGMAAQATARAAESAGLSIGDIDGVFTITPYHHLTSLSLCEYLGIFPRYHDTTQIGGCTFVAFLRHAAAAIAAGMCETAVIAYGASPRSDSGKLVSASETYTYHLPYGLLYPISGFALIAQRHMHEFGTTPEQLAQVAVAHREWAGLTDEGDAWFRDPITVDDVLSSPMVSSPIHRSDCCVVTDGGAAVIVTTRERAKDLRKPPLRVLGAAEGHTHRNVDAMASLTSSAAATTGPAAFAQAGLGPKDMDFLQLYDAFTITPIMMVEDLGYCAKGEGGSFYEDGRTRPGGALPINTNGGGLAHCHPGMLSLFLLTEACFQLWGECGRRQVPEAEVGLVHGLGGMFASAATAILARA